MSDASNPPVWTIDTLADPAVGTVEEAIRAARAMASTERHLDVRLVRRIWHARGYIQPEVAFRVLSIIPHISDGSRIFEMLDQLLRQPDPKLKSKVVLVMGRMKKDVDWVTGWMDDADPRVRANAVESLWGQSTGPARALFASATRDNNHRVAVNALVGLHRAGDPNAAFQLRQLVASSNPLMQAAAQWGLDEIGVKDSAEPEPVGITAP